MLPMAPVLKGGSRSAIENIVLQEAYVAASVSEGYRLRDGERVSGAFGNACRYRRHHFVMRRFDTERIFYLKSDGLLEQAI